MDNETQKITFKEMKDNKIKQIMHNLQIFASGKMKIQGLLNLVILFIVLLNLDACTQKTKSNTPSKNLQDTIIVKHKDVMNDNTFVINIYSKSYSYYWLVGKDTLDFRLNASEYKEDSAFNIAALNKSPMLFTDALKKIEACLPLIKEDFDVSKINSIYFNSPIYYLDLTKELSSEYEQKFGQKYMGYEKLNQFLLKSSLNLQLDNFLNPLNKKVKGYGIEKFQLIDKKDYNMRLPNVDTTEYPKFIIDGMGISVQLGGK